MNKLDNSMMMIAKIAGVEKEKSTKVINSLSACEVNGLVKRLKKNKVLEIAYSNICNLSEIKNEVRESFDLAMKQAYQIVKDEQIEEVANVFPEGTVFIKGSALKSLYPVNYKRYQGDIDVVVRSISDVWKVIPKLDEKYQFDRLKLYVYEEKPLKYAGSIDLKSREKDYDNVPSIDIHINPFYIWGATVYPYDIYEQSIKIGNKRIPEINHIIGILVSHIANHWVYRMRDINDLFVLSQNKAVDWDEVNRIIVGLNLQSIWNVLKRRYNEIYKVNLIEGEKLKKLKLSEFLFYKFNFGKTSAFGSGLIEFIYAYRNYTHKFSRMKSLKEALKNTWCMIRYKNRAYIVNKRRYVKKWKENQIIVLTLKKKYYGAEQEKAEEFKVVNIGKDNEVCISKLGEWKQETYHVTKE